MSKSKNVATDMTADDVLAALSAVDDVIAGTAAVETEAAAPEEVTAAPTAKRTRATAHEGEMRSNVEALSVAMGVPVSVERNLSETRYMRALFDLTVNGEPLMTALTVNEVALLAAFATRSCAIVTGMVEVDAVSDSTEIAIAA